MKGDHMSDAIITQPLYYKLETKIIQLDHDIDFAVKKYVVFVSAAN